MDGKRSRIRSTYVCVHYSAYNTAWPRKCIRRGYDVEGSSWSWSIISSSDSDRARPGAFSLAGYRPYDSIQVRWGSALTNGYWNLFIGDSDQLGGFWSNIICCAGYHDCHGG